MKRALKAVVVLLALLIVVNASGCTKKNKNENEYKSNDVTVINGKTFHFLKDEEKEKLRAPLIRMLSNETHEIYADTPRGEIIGYEPYDPDEPTVAQGYSCGLYDVTYDGIPELLVHPNGYHGSSGTVTYFVYDIESFEQIGMIDSGGNGSVCEYYYTEADAVRSVNTYWLRCGWTNCSRFIYILNYDEKIKSLDSWSFLHTSFTIDMNISDEVAGEIDGTYTATVEEFYPQTNYYADSKEVTLEEYYALFDSFSNKCIRIPETELRMIYWHEVSEKEDDRVTRAQKMVEALLSSPQKFIVP